MRLTQICILAVVIGLIPNCSVSYGGEEDLCATRYPQSARLLERQIHEIVSSTSKLDESDIGLWGSVKLKDLMNRPEALLPDVEWFLRCHPRAPDQQTHVAILVLQCLGMDAYLDFLNRLALLPAKGLSPWALLYGIAPGQEWSIRVESNYKEPRVSAVLKSIGRSPNADKRVKSAVTAILSGAAASYDKTNDERPVLQCPAAGGRPNTR